MVETKKIRGGGGTERDSNLELYRIIIMLLIVAHHYVVNSGLMESINESNGLGFNSVFLLLFGCWGKIGINCFVLITGYFMCTSNITVKKFLKLFLECVFYNEIIYLFFVLCGYQSFSLIDAFITLIPARTLTTGFWNCFIVFYLFIPFLNLGIQAMNEKQHRYLIMLSLGVFSLWATIPTVEVGMSYVFWFFILYFVSSYIRIHPIPLFENQRLWGWMSLLAVICSYASVLLMAWLKKYAGIQYGYYYFLSDSNKITALAVAVCFFLFFKNWKLEYNRTINMIASSTFGVLLIHANSFTMRQWLWKDICNNVGFFDSPYLVLHAFGVVIAVFAICIILDQMRIRFVERPVFMWLNRYKWFHKEIRMGK